MLCFLNIDLKPFSIYIIYLQEKKIIFSMWDLKSFSIYTLFSQEKSFFLMWNKKNF